MELQEQQFTVHRCPLAAIGRSEEILDGRYACDWVNTHPPAHLLTHSTTQQPGSYHVTDNDLSFYYMIGY